MEGINTNVDSNINNNIDNTSAQTEEKKELKEKTFFFSIFNEHKHKYRREDDFIMRYFSYRWFLQRVLSINEAFNDVEQEQFLALFVKNPEKYIELYKQLEVDIKANNINLEEFKMWLLEYLDEDQKQFIEKYKDVYMLTSVNGNKITFLDYIRQLEYEYITLSYMQFSGYINIMADVIVYAKQHHIGIGPARWSAGWSLISYFTRITDIDPLKYDLLFERFYHILKQEGDCPDIDTDFETTELKNILAYVRNKYGSDKVCKVGNYMQIGIKSQIKDMVRGSEVSAEDINRVTKSLGNKPDEINEWLKKLQAFYDGQDVDVDGMVWDILLKHRDILEPIFNILHEYLGYPKSSWVHACWVIVSPVDIEHLSPCRFTKKMPVKIGYFNKNEFEAGWMLKLDFLWLNNVNIIKNTIKAVMFTREDIQKKYGIVMTWDKEKDWENLDWYKMYNDIIENIGNGEDDDVFEKVFGLGITTWIFQFEWQWMRRWLKGIQVKTINELSDMNAMYRPWPMDNLPAYKDMKIDGIEPVLFSNDFIDSMIKKHGKEKTYQSIQFFEEIWADITDTTHGILVYQEQMMKLFNSLGHDYVSADYMRKIYSKLQSGKKTWKDLEKYDIKTKELLEEKWIIVDFYDYINEIILAPWARYGFNRSHAMAYAIVAYTTAWLKTNYKEEFFTSLLKSAETGTGKMSLKVQKLVTEMNVLWVELMWPSINNSQSHAIIIDEYDEAKLWIMENTNTPEM